MRLLTMLLLVTVMGCHHRLTPEQQIAQAKEMCASYGIPADDPRFAECVMLTHQTAAQEAMAARQNSAAALRAFGQQMMQNSSAPPAVTVYHR